MESPKGRHFATENFNIMKADKRNAIPIHVQMVFFPSSSLYCCSFQEFRKSYFPCHCFHFASPHHAEGLVNPKVLPNKKVTDFGYPKACRFRKHQIPELALPTFFNM
jgi:hypothetical protein